MQLHKLMIMLIASGLANNTFAQDPDKQLKDWVESERAKEALAEQEQLKRLAPAEREKIRRIKAADKAAFHRINGKENPDLVPYRMRMQMFFEGYNAGHFRRELETQLGTEDLALLDAFEQSSGKDERAHGSRSPGVDTNRLTGTKYGAS